MNIIISIGSRQADRVLRCMQPFVYVRGRPEREFDTAFLYEAEIAKSIIGSISITGVFYASPYVIWDSTHAHDCMTYSEFMTAFLPNEYMTAFFAGYTCGMEPKRCKPIPLYDFRVVK